MAYASSPTRRGQLVTEDGVLARTYAPRIPEDGTDFVFNLAVLEDYIGELSFFNLAVVEKVVFNLAVFTRLSFQSCWFSVPSRLQEDGLS